MTLSGCEQFAHGVTYNEVMKLFAMGYSWSGNASHLAASNTASVASEPWLTCVPPLTVYGTKPTLYTE